MDFCTRLYSETKEDHKQVDHNPFVTLIKTNSDAGRNYMWINILCIDAIQKCLDLNDKNLQDKLYRKSGYIPGTFMTSKLQELIIRCEHYPLEHSYMFYLGIISGGSILKKYIIEKYHYHEYLTLDFHKYLTYDNPKKLSLEFKKYLNENVHIDQQDSFIKNVKYSYKLIKEIFDGQYKSVMAKAKINT